tara:strand:+ start:11644 stop:11820 length:177 start_codon:yes stop_codon:yes gene_type:complete
MKDVEVKKEEKKAEAPKVAVKKAKKDEAKVKFMEDRNAKRKQANLKPAYSEEEIKAYK